MAKPVWVVVTVTDAAVFGSTPVTVMRPVVWFRSAIASTGVADSIAHVKSSVGLKLVTPTVNPSAVGVASPKVGVNLALSDVPSTGAFATAYPLRVVVMITSARVSGATLLTSTKPVSLMSTIPFWVLSPNQSYSAE